MKENEENRDQLTDKHSTDQATRGTESFRDRIASIQRLAGGIAHSLNNFLMTIVLYADILLEDPSLAPELAPSVESILEEAQDASRLVRQLLDFGGRSVIEACHLDLRTFVYERIVALYRALPQTLRLLLDISPGEYLVNADPTYLEQAVMNLVANAGDSMKDGGELRIELSTARVGAAEEPPAEGMPPGDWVCLAIADSGAGIPPETLPHLFEPFSSSKPQAEATGLGLAQVYGIVKQHGGYVAVVTKVGRGTTFRIYLPAEKEKVPESEEVPQKTTVPSLPMGETILLVEDQERLRRGSQKILESLGYAVLAAAGAKEALELYRGTKVDLLLTDIVMPKMDGKELIRELWKMDPGLKVVAMTGSVLASDLQVTKEEGDLDIVHKPFGKDVLASVIRSALDR